MYDYNLEEKRFEVELYHETFGRLGSGVLYFGGNRWPYVNLSSLDISPDLMVNNAKFNLIKAINKEGSTYCLSSCQIKKTAMYVDYVVYGDFNETTCDLISVRYENVSEWFLHWRMLEGSIGETITWKNLPEPLNISVRTREEQFDLRSQYCSIRRQRGEELVIKEYIEFIFSANSKKFNFSDVKKKTHELLCLFSILLSDPVTIISVAISQEGGRFHQIHFPTNERPERTKDDGSFWLQAFVQQPKIEGRWQSIFDHYYQSKYRKICWTRLAGMQRYTGLWEYKALGYIALLDGYLNIRFRGKKPCKSQLPSTKKLEKLCQSIARELPHISIVERTKIREIASETFATKNFTFEHMYEQAIIDTDPDVTKIINLSASEFSLIKQVRNKIAHGDDHGLTQDQFPIVMRTQSKIILFLTYWAFFDFGFTARDFISYLNQTHNKIKLMAMVDDLHLDRVTQSAEFFHVTPEKFELLQSVKHLHALCFCVENDTDGLIFSEEFSKKYSDWLHGITKSSSTADPEEIFGLSKGQARFVQRGHFEAGNIYLTLHGFWIINENIFS